MFSEGWKGRIGWRCCGLVVLVEFDFGFEGWGLEIPEGRVNGWCFWGFNFLPWERCFWRLFLPILKVFGGWTVVRWGLAQRVLKMGSLGGRRNDGPSRDDDLTSSEKNVAV